MTGPELLCQCLCQLSGHPCAYQVTCHSLSFPFCKIGMVILILSSCT